MEGSRRGSLFVFPVTMSAKDEPPTNKNGQSTVGFSLWKLYGYVRTRTSNRFALSLTLFLRLSLVVSEKKSPRVRSGKSEWRVTTPTIVWSIRIPNLDLEGKTRTSNILSRDSMIHCFTQYQW